MLSFVGEEEEEEDKYGFLLEEWEKRQFLQYMDNSTKAVALHDTYCSYLDHPKVDQVHSGYIISETKTKESLFLVV
jgi:hypothetical protein